MPCTLPAYRLISPFFCFALSPTTRGASWLIFVFLFPERSCFAGGCCGWVQAQPHFRQRTLRTVLVCMYNREFRAGKMSLEKPTGNGCAHWFLCFFFFSSPWVFLGLGLSDEVMVLHRLCVSCREEGAATRLDRDTAQTRSSHSLSRNALAPAYATRGKRPENTFAHRHTLHVKQAALGVAGIQTHISPFPKPSRSINLLCALLNHLTLP
jgi:hypothetical protein